MQFGWNFIGVGTAKCLPCIKTTLHVGKIMNNLHFIYIFMVVTGWKRLYFPNHYLTRVDLLMLFSKNTSFPVSPPSLKSLSFHMTLDSSGISWDNPWAEITRITEYVAAVQSRCPGRKTRQVLGELGSVTEKRTSVDAQVTAGLLAVQPMNGAALSPCRGSWETLRPSLYGNHTPAAVSWTLPLHLC